MAQGSHGGPEAQGLARHGLHLDRRDGGEGGVPVRGLQAAEALVEATGAGEEVDDRDGGHALLLKIDRMVPG